MRVEQYITSPRVSNKLSRRNTIDNSGVKSAMKTLEAILVLLSRSSLKQKPFLLSIATFAKRKCATLADKFTRTPIRIRIISHPVLPA